MVNKRQYKSNRSYQKGYDDGYDDGFGKGIRSQKNKVEIVKERLAVEEAINNQLRADVKSEKAIAEEQKAIAEERSARCDELECEVNAQKGRIDALKEEVDEISAEIDNYQEEYDNICGEIDDLHVSSDKLDARNHEIDCDLIAVADKAYLSDSMRETFSKLRRELNNEKRANTKSISSNQRRCDKLGKEAEGINSKLRNAKADYCNKVIALVNNA